MWLYAVIGLVAVQRVGELVLARRNTRRLLAEGGHEVGREHYPLIVLLHTAWLIALLVAVPPTTPPDAWWLSFFLLLQVARVAVIASLGPRWTTRVIVMPGRALVRRGPYRWLRHPNYAVVAAEIVALPLAFGALWVALAFGLANAALLGWRIRVEDRALGRS